VPSWVVRDGSCVRSKKFRAMSILQPFVRRINRAQNRLVETFRKLGHNQTYFKEIWR
jgi:hypothetical protein